ncbi:MAG: hypothetical protein WC702_03545 [Patescibacteria group bacterium]|jgi:hypothetical protein
MTKLKTLLAGLTIFVLSAPIARADVVTVNEMFGGNAGDEFANEAGLGAGDLTSTIANLIRVGLGFLGIVAVVIILIGGFKWVTAGGEEEKVKKAKKYIFQGLIGLVIVLAAYAIATFALGAITTAMNSSV